MFAKFIGVYLPCPCQFIASETKARFGDFISWTFASPMLSYSEAQQLMAFAASNPMQDSSAHNLATDEM